MYLELQVIYINSVTKSFMLAKLLNLNIHLIVERHYKELLYFCKSTIIIISLNIYFVLTTRSERRPNIEYNAECVPELLALCKLCT